MQGVLKRALAMLLIGVLLGFLGASFRAEAEEDKGFIRYAEFNVPYKALRTAMNADIESEGAVDWVDALAWLAAKYGGEWSRYKEKDLTAVLEKLTAGETLEEIKYYDYFREVYSAVLGGFLGNNLVETGEGEWEYTYGLRVFSPLAAGYWYNDFDDFGVSRSYGFARTHMGHDLMGSLGSPVVAVESGTVEVMGWNQYGGWRIGIRSDDRKRYWYYAHLRKDHPFTAGLTEGSRVIAGDVIGYLGRTGYSHNENVNGIETPHLHYGLELVFDESQKESNNEIWVDLYAITRLLRDHPSEVVREGDEYVRARHFLLCGEGSE